MKIKSSAGILMLCAWCSLGYAQQISESQIKNVVSTLASDEMQGRKIGTPENQRAAEYIASQFKKDHLSYCWGNSYLIPFTMKNGTTAYNVCGIKKGKTESLLAFGAHFDHIGTAKSGEDRIYNGADDDASGVSVVLGLADYYSNQSTNYGMIFMTFNGEEIGLVGSRFLAEDEQFQQYVPKIKALFNFEMLGTVSAFGPNKVFMTGNDESDLQKILNENAPKGFKIEDDPYLSQKLFYRSDNVSFFKKGIVAHSFSTVDMDHQNHYHRVNDEVDIINFKNLTEITNSFAKTLDHLMQTNFSPSYNKK